MIESQQPTNEHPKKRRFGCLWLFVGFCLFSLAWCSYTPLNRFPADALAALRSDPEAVFYSVDPSPEIDDQTSRFHGYPIVGQIRLASSSDRAAIVDRMAVATHGAWDRAACFDPRHAFRALGAKGVFDFLLCFQCGQAQVYHPDGRSEMILITGSPDFFDDYLKAHEVSLPSR